jgi:NDP-sugar pyrophosphorylase family protein
MQAIILCGGKGTRLKGAIPEGLPKPMADVKGQPFLWYLLNHWHSFIDTFVLATGYGHETIADFFGDTFEKSQLKYSQDIRGTHNAVYLASGLITDTDFFVINGDTFLDLWPPAVMEFHRLRGEDFTACYSVNHHKHAGVDVLKTKKEMLRISIYPTSAYFCDIGTPESLQAFRHHAEPFTNQYYPKPDRSY